MNTNTVKFLSLLFIWLLSFIDIIKSHTVEVCNVVAADGKSVSLYAGTYHNDATQSGGILLTPPGGVQTRYDFTSSEADTNEEPPACSDPGVTCDCSRCDSTNSITGKWGYNILYWYKVTVNTVVDGFYEVSTTQDSDIEHPDCSGWSFTVEGSVATSKPTENPTPSPVNTPEPTPHPTPSILEDKPVCETEVRFNIHFVIDESNSMNRFDYQEQINFVQVLVYSDVNPGSKVAALEFSHENDIVWNFDDDQGNNRFPIIAALEQEKNSFDRTKPAMTHTYSALIEAIEMFEQPGAIQDPDANLIFLITDGAPTLNDVNGQFPCRELTGLPTTSGLEIITKLIEKNIRLYILGVGDSWATQHGKVECLANDAYIYDQPNFTPEEFELIEEEFRQILCYGEGVVSD